MPTARATLSVAVVNDTIYALGGTNNLFNPQAPTNSVNEQYFPLGYGEPAQSASHNPITSPSTPQGTVTYYVIVAVVLIILIIIVAVAVTLFLRRRHSSISARSTELRERAES
jgi:hypothetical protein